MKKKQVRKILRRLDALQARIDHLAAQEKRLIDRVVGLTTEHVGRLLREDIPSEKQIVDAVGRALRADLQAMLARERLDVEALAAELARRLRDEAAAAGSRD